MPQVIVGRTDLISRKHTENGLYAAKIPVPVLSSLNGMCQMNMNYFCHILLIYRCKYTK